MGKNKEKKRRVGIIGTGFISRNFTLAMEECADLEISRVLTRRNIASCREFPRKDLLTNSLNDVLDHCDIVLETSGDAVHAAEAVHEAFKASLPVVTMDTEFHVTVGSYFVGKGVLSEAEGDQPGSQAALHENAVAMGFKPLAYVNVKGFHNINPTPEEMAFWSKKQGLSLPMVTGATDGTKMQFEQALVANFFSATILKDGMTGEGGEDLTKLGFRLAESAKKTGKPVCDYCVSPKSPVRVFIVAEHDSRQKAALDYYKFGTGPYYILPQSIMLCHLEIAKTIRRMFKGEAPLLDNSRTPSISMAAVAKKHLPAGTKIEFGCGCFEVRGIAVKISDHYNHVPIGLLKDAHIRKDVEPGRVLTFDDAEIPDSLALKAWKHIESSVKETAVAQ